MEVVNIFNPTNRPSSGRAVEEGGDNPPVETPPVDNPPVDTPPEDVPPVDTPPTDNPPVDNPPVETPPTDVPPVETPPVELTEAEKITAAIEEQKKAWLADLGWDSIEDGKARIAEASKKPLTPEEIAANESAYQDGLVSFGISKKLITPQDLVALDAVKDLSDHDIVYGNFTAEYKAAHKGRTTDGPDGLAPIPHPVTEEEIQEEFDNLYHTNSDSNFLKQRGENLIKKEAEDARKGPQAKFDTAKSQYDAHRDKEVNIPAFQTFVESTVGTSIPEQLEIKTGDTVFNFKLKDTNGNLLYDKSAIENLFINDAVFKSFLKDADKKTIGTYIQKEVGEYLLRTNRDAINKELAEFWKEKGLKDGSNVGASAQFSQEKKDKPVVTDDSKMSPEQEERVRRNYADPFGR